MEDNLALTPEAGYALTIMNLTVRVAALESLLLSKGIVTEAEYAEHSQRISKSVIQTFIDQLDASKFQELKAELQKLM